MSCAQVPHARQLRGAPRVPLWQAVGQLAHTHVYAAHWDARVLPTVRVLLYTGLAQLPPLYCQFWYDTLIDNSTFFHFAFLIHNCLQVLLRSGAGSSGGASVTRMARPSPRRRRRAVRGVVPAARSRRAASRRRESRAGALRPADQRAERAGTHQLIILKIIYDNPCEGS